MAKVMNNRIEKLSNLLDANVSDINEISSKHENAIDESSGNSSSSSSSSSSFIVPNSNLFIVASSSKEHTSESSKKRFKTSVELNIHKRIHSKHKRFACDQCKMTFTRKLLTMRGKRVKMLKLTRIIPIKHMFYRVI